MLVGFWSSGFVGATLGTRYAPADTLLAWRYLAGAGVLLCWVGARSLRVGGRALVRHCVLGLLCQCVYLGGVVTGVSLGVPAGTAALVAALQPLVVATLAGPLLGERTSRAQRTGLLLGLVGVAVVVAGELGAGTAPGWGFLLPVAGMLALAGGTVLERRWRPTETLLESLAVQTTVGAVFFVALATASGHLAPPRAPGFWWSVAWVVVLSSFGGYGAYFLVLRRAGATRVSTLLYLTPPTTMLWAYAMFGQEPGLSVLPGGLLCAVAVHLSGRPRPATTTVAAPGGSVVSPRPGASRSTGRRPGRCAGCRRGTRRRPTGSW